MRRGYARLPRRTTFSAALGQIYEKTRGGDHAYAVRVRKRHLNLSATAHGGFIATFADFALSRAGSGNVPGSQTTINLSCDFLHAAREGDWIEIDVRVLRQGRKLVFLSGDLRTRDRPIARVSAVMMARKPIGRR